MISLLKIEICRLFHKKNILVCIIGICLTSIIAWNYQKQDDAYFEKQKEAMQTEMEKVASTNAYIAQLLETYASPENQAQLLFLQDFSSQSVILKGYYGTSNLKEPKGFLKASILHDTLMLEGIEKAYDMPLQYAKDKQITVLKEQLAIHNYMMKHEITPYNSPYTMNASNFLVKLFENGTPLLFATVILMLFYDVYIKEFDSGAYKIIFTQPLSRSKIYVSKLFTVFIRLLLSLIIMFIPVVVVLACCNGTGSLSYPVWIGENEIMESGRYMIQLLIFFLIYFIFIAVTIFAISIFIPSLSILFLSFGGIVIFVYCMYTVSGMRFILAQIVPFFYCYGIDILRKQANISIWVAMVVMIVIIVALIVMSYRHFIKQDLLDVVS